MSCLQRRARAPSLAEDLPRPWRGVRALPSRALRARLARARGAEANAWQAADGFAQTLLFRYYRALERGARLPRRQRGRRPRVARQRLSLRHGHAGGRVAGSRPVDFGRRAVGHPRRTGAGFARRGRQDAGVRLTRFELTLLDVREQRETEETEMSQQVARTPGAKRAGDGEYVFDLAAVNHILGGPDYSTANGACVEGDRMIVALMRMPAGTGAQPHSHPNEQWILHSKRHVSGKDWREGNRGQARLGSLRSLQRRALRRGDARGRRRLLHVQGCLPQPARRQGSVTPTLVAAPLMVLRVR